MNDDRVAPWHEYGTHARRDVEIVTYVLEVHCDIATDSAAEGSSQPAASSG